MRTFIFLLFLPLILWGQTDTEVILFDIHLQEDGTYAISNPENISSNPGYDNQPSFVDNENLLFAKTRNKQTDIALYHIPSKNTIFKTNTPGGEYSPTPMPNGKEISAIRLDPDGKQLLYAYHMRNKGSRPIFDTMKVGYHVWVDNRNLVSFVLTNPNSLVISNLKKRKNYTIESGIGRSLQRIPNSEQISYIKKELGSNRIMALDVFKKEKTKIANLPPEVEDICWTPKGHILMGDQNSLYQLLPNKDKNWKPIANMTEFGLKNITRLAVSPDGKKLALVAEVNPEAIVDKQYDAFQNGNYADFEKYFDKNIQVAYYPCDIKVKGLQAFKNAFQRFFTEKRSLDIINRTVQGNKVIDQLKAQTVDGEIYNTTILEVKNAKIIKITYIW
ncbi:MAG: hypothetical protein OIF50_11070 [Flavobacteriaceae bacterium]|nr:hypothetical protein [Flavobacteriaceae bacterium]